MTTAPIRAVTFDFWNTIYRQDSEPPRQIRRLKCFSKVLERNDIKRDQKAISDAFLAAFQFANQAWKVEHRTVDSRERIDHAMNVLDLSLPEKEIAEITTFFEDVLLDDPPKLLPGVHDSISTLAEHHPLAIISDTGYSPGTTLRQLLEINDLLDKFSVFVFSDETGCAKPDAKAFHAALDGLKIEPANILHIGDIERTDVEGARGVGMQAALYTGGTPRKDSPPDKSSAEVILKHHSHLLEIVNSA